MTDTDVKAPKIEFPNADYPIKIIADTGVGVRDKVIEIVAKHAVINHELSAERQSSNGKYTTTGQDQLYDINSELRATGFVHMVL
jgi:putative lipoic acid-binding regulatory protein